MIAFIFVLGVFGLIAYQFSQELKESYAYAGRAFFHPMYVQNDHELFSVAAENFFELAAEFKKSIPDPYAILGRLLEQDLSLWPCVKHI